MMYHLTNHFKKQNKEFERNQMNEKQTKTKQLISRWPVDNEKSTTMSK